MVNDWKEYQLFVRDGIDSEWKLVNTFKMNDLNTMPNSIRDVFKEHQEIKSELSKIKKMLGVIISSLKIDKKKKEPTGIYKQGNLLDYAELPDLVD